MEGALRYPLGRWRLSSKADKSVVWVSHLVVMHSGSRADGVLRPDGWMPEAVPQRTPEEAYRIAVDLRNRLDAAPEQFAQVARQFSDDVATREAGGSLGGVVASRLPAVFLDALEALRAGAVSDVLSTPLGYHVILKRAAPPEDLVAGARVVVRYSTTTGDAPSARSRADALQLSRTIVDAARGGRAFEELVAEYSEHADKLRHGALGTWSTTESSDAPRVLESLGRLAVGAVSDPIDTPAGFQIVKRTPVTPTDEFAMRVIEVSYDEDASEASIRSPKAAQTRADHLADTLHKHAEGFSSWHKIMCCRGVERWLDGHGDPVVTTTLEGLKFGEVYPKAIKLPDRFVVVQRVDPDMLSAAADPHQVDLPLAERVDIESIFERTSSENIARSVGEAKAALSAPGLSPRERATVLHAFDDLLSDLAKTGEPEERVAAYRRAQSALYTGLAEASYAETMSGIQDWAAMKLLTRVNKATGAVSGKPAPAGVGAVTGKPHTSG